MEFIEKKETQNGEEVINYFINNKQVDKKTYDILSTDEFCKKFTPKFKNIDCKSKQKKFKSDNIPIENSKYAKTFLKELSKLTEEEDKILFITGQIDDLVILSYYSGQIDLSKSLETGMKGLTKELKDLSENFSQEDL
jgi:hypothetical protein